MANGNLPYPFPDAVSQFSVESTDLGAQDGGHVGGMVNVVTQSGTNQYHGEAFEFIRNNYIDATNFFSSTPDTLHQNQFGGTFGGPIKRNKMFAFAAYQRTQGRSVAVEHAGHGAHGGQPDWRFFRHRRRSRRYRQQSMQLNTCAHPAGRSAHRRGSGGKQISNTADLQRAGAGTAEIPADTHCGARIQTTAGLSSMPSRTC